MIFMGRTGQCNDYSSVGLAKRNPDRPVALCRASGSTAGLVVRLLFLNPTYGFCLKPQLIAPQFIDHIR
jgi:hypothetical protein